MLKVLTVSIGIALAFAVGCHQTNEVVDVQRPRISLTVFHLPRLGPGEGYYQLWAKFVIFDRPAQADSPQHDSSAVSLGEFNVTTDGRGVVGLDGNPVRFAIPPDQDPQLLDLVFISVQLPDSASDDVGPTFLAGRVTGDVSTAVADMDVAHAAALGSTFSSVTGGFTIIAPTSPADSNSGVWFIEKQGAAISAGLRNLPVLPRGWRYEGWIDREVQAAPGGPTNHLFSTGKFLRADSADFDGAGPGSGPGGGLNFPGQDFINSIPSGTPSRPDLRLFTFMVTVEPEPDNSPAPFPLTILSTTLPSEPLPQGRTLLMNNVASTSFPRARVTIIRSGY